MQWKANHNVFIYFEVILPRFIWQPRRIKQTRKTNLFKKLDVVVMEK